MNAFRRRCWYKKICFAASLFATQAHCLPCFGKGCGPDANPSKSASNATLCFKLKIGALAFRSSSTPEIIRVLKSAFFFPLGCTTEVYWDFGASYGTCRLFLLAWNALCRVKIHW